MFTNVDIDTSKSSSFDIFCKLTKLSIFDFVLKFLNAMTNGLTPEQLAQIQQYCALANVTLA